MSARLGKIGLVSLTGLVVWLVLQSPAMVLSQSPTSSAAGGNEPVELVSTMLPTGIQQVVLLDRRSTTLAVYHIEPTQGKIQLKSVRNVTWDLRMEQFNGQTPLPSELRQVQP